MTARAAHKATTANFEAIYPFQVETGLGPRGIYIGRGSFGSAFVFDPWELYRQRILSNPNCLVLGEVGSGKTSLIKTIVYRSSVFRDRRAVIVDPKGEYGNLAHLMGTEPIQLRPGGQARLNPLNPRAGTAAQLSLLLAVASAALERPLRPVEQAATTQAMHIANQRAENARTEPVIPDIVNLLLRPTAEMAKKLAKQLKALQTEISDVALALLQLCEGDLAGMFDGATSANVNFDASVVVLDLSAVQGSKAIGILMACASAWLQAEILRQRQDNEALRNLWIVDEGWKILKHEGVGEWLQSSYKLARAYGIANIMVIHRLTDFHAAGADGTRAQLLAKGLLADTGTRIIYRQPEDELPLLRSSFRLTSQQSHQVITAGDGEALWNVGQHSYAVRHDLSRFERQLINSDGQMGVQRAGFEEAAYV